MFILEIVIVIVLILVNGLFSMSEMAIVAAKKNRLQQEADDQNKGAKRALELINNPDRFFSTVQIFITLIGILSGAFGGATIAQEIGASISTIPKLAPYGETIGVAVVVILVTYFSLVLGELVPKRLALNNAEKIASGVSKLMHTLSRITNPLVIFLSKSTNLVLRLLGAKPSSEPEVTDEDVTSMMHIGARIGVFEKAEQEMVERIFRLSDRNAGSLMTPRTEVVFLEIDSSDEKIYQTLLLRPYSRFPVIKDTFDDVIGIVNSRDLFLQRINGQQFDIQGLMSQPIFLPESTPALSVLENFRLSGSETAVVIDEYGGVMGLLSMNDVIEAIVGDTVPSADSSEEKIILRDDGTWLIDGMVQVDEVKELLGIDELPDENEGHYETISGLMMTHLGRIPRSSDKFEWQGFTFEVMDMDRNRVDKVLVGRTKAG